MTRRPYGSRLATNQPYHSNSALPRLINLHSGEPHVPYTRRRKTNCTGTSGRGSGLLHRGAKPNPVGIDYICMYHTHTTSILKLKIYRRQVDDTILPASELQSPSFKVSREFSHFMSAKVEGPRLAKGQTVDSTRGTSPRVKMPGAYSYLGQ